MTDEFHPGTFITGLVYAVIGAAFVAEALGAWTFEVGDLALIGPLALIVVGAALFVAGFRRRSGAE